MIPFEFWKNVLAPSHPFLRRLSLIYRAAEMRAVVLEALSAIAEGSLSGEEASTTLRRLVTAINQLDLDFEVFGQNYFSQANQARYQIVKSDRVTCPEWLKDIIDRPGKPTTIHIYAKLSDAYSWNIFRCARILLGVDSLSCLQILESSGTPPPPPARSPSSPMPGVKLRTETIIFSQIDDICASVFAHLYHTALDEQEWAPDATSLSNIRAYRGLVLLFPLWVVLKAEKRVGSSGDADTFNWVRGLLDYIGKSLGVAWAHAVVDNLKN